MATTSISIGRVPVYRGEYDQSATYYRDNIVSHSYAIWVCLADNTAGIPPSAGSDAWSVLVPSASEKTAVTDRDNAWSAQQTFGDILVRGNIIQQGEAYETHAEVVYTVQDMVHLREGAVSGIPAGSFAGLVAQRYNGTDDGYLVYDAQGARVGKAGDTEPLLTRAEKEDMVPFAPLVWDAQRSRAVSGEWPELPELPVMRTVEMVVTYEDDSTETFNVYVQ